MFIEIIKLSMQITMSFVDDNIKEVSSKKRIRYFNAIEPDILGDTNNIEQVLK